MPKRRSAMDKLRGIVRRETMWLSGKHPGSAKIMRAVRALLKERAEAAVQAACSGLFCGRLRESLKPMQVCNSARCTGRREAIRSAVLGGRKEDK